MACETSAAAQGPQEGAHAAAFSGTGGGWGMSYDPALHHRKSIRLKGHDYAGGGVYFITICAHREFIAWARGNPFGALGARQASPVRALIEERMRITAEKCPQMRWGAWVIMPDHFHALIRMQEGPLRLGDVIGGFKAAVSREWNRATRATQVSPVRRRRGEACLAAPIAGGAPIAPRMWHRNYYESIVRSDAAEQRIAEYIRLNPWRCVQELGDGLRGIGNPALWSGEKLGVLCSRNSPKIGRLPDADVYYGGWHSPKEKEILDWLLKTRRRVIACPAWGIEDSAFAPGVRNALEDNRMLILEMRDHSGNLAAAEARNRFVIERADSLFTPHVAPGGMLDRLLKERLKANAS
jgi:REP element-mobilizing transposase RayT